MEFARDLASADLWADSLERSLARRGRPRRASLELGRLTAERDLADPGTVGESTVYWRARRAASSGVNIPAPAVGGASVLALLAATTIPALSGGGSSTHRKGSLQRPASGSGTSGTTPAVVRHAQGMPAVFDRTVSTPASSSGIVLTAATHPATSSKVHVLGTGVPAAEAATDVHVLGATVATPATPAATGAATTIAQPKHVVYGKVTFGDLRDAQRMLGVGVDDVLGPNTGAAIRAFQAAHGLSVDGVIGPATWNALKNREHASMHAAAQAREAAAATQSLGTSGVREAAALQPAAPAADAATDVMALQQALGVSADGTFGASTVSAVEAFQSAHGLTADGVVGPATRIALGLGDGPTLVAPGSSGGTADATTITTAATDPTSTTDAATSASTDSTTASSDSSGAASTTTSSSVTLALSEMIAAANQIQSLPYIWGGGHGSWVSPGYDCSGSVSYVLHAAGLLSVPEDSSALESYGAPGPGQYITIYANAGHAWMTIEGRRFDTVSLSETGSRWSSGGGEFAGFVVRHPVGF